jgi:hypothetical protein
MSIVQENEPGVPAQLTTTAETRVRKRRSRPCESARAGRCAYFGGELESGGGGAVESEFGEPLGGAELSAGGIVVVVPGAAD